MTFSQKFRVLLVRKKALELLPKIGPGDGRSFPGVTHPGAVKYFNGRWEQLTLLAQLVNDAGKPLQKRRSSAALERGPLNPLVGTLQVVLPVMSLG